MCAGGGRGVERGVVCLLFLTLHRLPSRCLSAEKNWLAFQNTETKYKICEIDLPPISDERQALVVKLRLQSFVSRPRRRLLNDHIPIESTHSC